MLPTRGRISRGTAVAIPRCMAAVLCLIFLPLFFATLFMLGAMGGPLSVGVLFAGAAFILLAGGIVVGAMNLSRGWEEERLD